MKDGEVFTINVTDAQISTHVITADGTDFVITVTYGPEAEIPDGVKLEADEITPGSDEYNEYCAKTLKSIREAQALEAPLESIGENAGENGGRSAGSGSTDAGAGKGNTDADAGTGTGNTDADAGTGTGNTDADAGSGTGSTDTAAASGTGNTGAGNSDEASGTGAGSLDMVEDVSIGFARFFDIRIMKGTEKVEPAAPVKVTVTYAEALNVDEEETLLAVHFGENGTEVIEAVSGFF